MHNAIMQCYMQFYSVEAVNTSGTSLDQTSEDQNCCCRILLLDARQHVRRKAKDIQRFQNTVVFFLPQMCGLLQRGDLHSLFVDLLAPGEMSETPQWLPDVCGPRGFFSSFRLNHSNFHHMSV